VRRWLLIGVLIVVALALSSSVAATTTEGGLYGTVTRGPTRPVCVAELPCSRPAAVTLEFARGGTVAAGVVTGRDGIYRVALREGVYLVWIITPSRSVRRIDPPRIRVFPARWSRQNFSIDTGIR
jgi:hypothetical protein